MHRHNPDHSLELNRFSIRWPVLISFAMGMLVFLTFLQASIWWLAERIQSDLLVEEIQEVGTHIKNLMDQDSLGLYEHLAILAKMPPLSEAFLAGDREKLLATSQPILKALQEQQMTRWVFYRPDSTIFLQVHRPDLSDDDDQAQSKTVRNAQQTGQFTFGMETGRTGIPSFRGVLPWQVNGKIIGYLELSRASMPLIQRWHEQTGVTLFPFFHKNQLDKETFLAGCNLLHLHANWDAHPELVTIVPASGQIPEEVQEYLQSDKWRAEPFQQTTFIATHPDQSSNSSNKHLLFSIPVQDADKTTVMRIVAVRENLSLQNLFQTQAFLFAKLALVMTVLLGWVFYRHLGKVEERIQKTALHILEIAKNLTKAQQIAQIGNWEWHPSPPPSLICSEQTHRIIGGETTIPMTSFEALFTWVHPEDQAMVQEAIQRFLSSKLPKFDLEYRHLHQGGELRFVHLRIEAIRNPAATAPPALIGTLQDITKQKHLEQLSKRNAIFQQYALESMADGILLTDDMGKIIYYNGRFLSMWHISRELVELGREKQVLACIQPQLKDPEAFMKQMELLYGSQEVGMDMLALKDGRYLERHTNPILRAKELLGREWRFVDITTHYQADPQ